MIDATTPTGVDPTVALEWLRYSLGQGEVISPAVLKVIEERPPGHSYTLAPDMDDKARLMKPREGGVTETRAAQEGLAKVLETLAGRGAACVVVEDELSLRKDPKPSLGGLLQTAFVGERVIHWAGLAGGTEAAILTLHHGSHGYPTNAFVMSASAEELGLVDGADLDSAVASRVVGSLMAVVVAAYDAETYIIWEPC
jgi:hypothetical protein